MGEAAEAAARARGWALPAAAARGGTRPSTDVTLAVLEGLHAYMRRSPSGLWKPAAPASGRPAAEEPPTPSTPDLEAEDTAKRGRPEGAPDRGWRS